MGLFDKLFGKKKSSETQSDPQPVHKDQPQKETAPPADAENDELSRQATAEPEPTAETGTPQSEQPDASDSSQQNSPETSSREEPSAPETSEELKPSDSTQDDAPKEEPDSAKEPAASIECTGCGRQLPIPLPGHPAKVTCPFCATENEYRP